MIERMVPGARIAPWCHVANTFNSIPDQDSRMKLAKARTAAPMKINPSSLPFG
jgi:hypothetical protein